MRTLRIDRILVLTGTCLLLIFLGFDWLAPKLMSDSDLGRVAAIGIDTVPAADPLLQQAEAKPLTNPGAAFPFERRDLVFGPRVAYEDTDLAGFEDRRSREDRFRRTLTPPVRLRWKRVPKGVLIEWDGGARNDAIATEVGANPLLRIGYRVYRWRVGEDPAVIATGALDLASCLDRDLGLRGGRVFYAVATVLEGRIGDQDTLIESERSEVLAVDLEDAFDLRLVGGSAGRVTIEVVAETSDGTLRHSFTVGLGDAVGGPVPGPAGASGAPADLRTGFTVAEISDAPATQDQVVRHPVFKPDGSRAKDDEGFLFREEVRKIPVQRLSVRCVNERGDTRLLTIDRP